MLPRTLSDPSHERADGWLKNRLNRFASLKLPIGGDLLGIGDWARLTGTGGGRSVLELAHRQACRSLSLNAWSMWLCATMLRSAPDHALASISVATRARSSPSF